MKTLTAFFIAFFFLPLPISHAASMQAFLNIRNIPGESTDELHPGWIQVDSYKWGVSQTGSVANPIGGKSTFENFTITKPMDIASPKLYQTCAAGTAISSATLSVFHPASGLEVLQIRFTDVMISSVKPAATLATDPFPKEEVQFNYSTIVWIYKRQRPTGGTETVTGGWNLITNTAITIPAAASVSIELTKMR